MSPGFLLGRVSGIPIRVRWSFLFLLGFAFFAAGGVAGVFAVLVAFASVVLHELGHATVARRLGVRIGGIDLHFFGGAAQMIDTPRSARDEMLIAAAGPAVSLALAAVGLGLGGALALPFLAMVGWINLVLGLFNLVPALPMDGGRILRAALSLRLGYVRATHLAVAVARVFLVAFAVVGIAAGSLQLVVLAVVLWLMTTAEKRRAAFTSYDGRDSDLHDLPRGGQVRTYIVRW
jgi:Zn-dependent protease